MASQTSASEVSSTTESHVPNSQGNDGPHTMITGHRLNGHNFLQWSQSVLMFICGKGKEDYLTGEITAPEKEDPKYRTWKIENHLVMSWLINTMNNDIGENFLLYGTAKEIWDAAKETYSNSENTSELFQVEAQLHDLRQGNLSVTQYFNSLSRCWQQLDMFEVFPWKCKEDGAIFKKVIEQKRTFKFLLGLNKDLDEVRGRLMGVKPFPSTREAFSAVRHEESRRKVMMGPQTEPLEEGSALSVRGYQQNYDNKQRKGRPWCDHCKKPGHLKETCWKIHGKPADWKPRNSEDQGNTSQVHKANSAPFTKEQIEMLQQLFSQQTQTSATACTAGKPMSGPWLIDSGATDHMTADETQFSTYKPNSSNALVRVANGSLSKVKGTGSVILTKDITLQSVLHVPTLECNLISVSKITHDLHCEAKFSPNSCVFQGLNSKQMIGSARECLGLYILNQKPQTTPQCLFSNFQSLNSNKDANIMLWHFRLGHLNFMYLQKMFPSLFINKNPNSFSCEICQLAKHTRSTYTPLNYKPSKPFTLIHSDVWGPSRIKNISGSRWFVSFIDDHTRLTWLFLMKEKSQVEDIFRRFNSMIQTQFQTKVQILKTDNALEYFKSTLGSFLLDQGILHISSCAHTPQQNGVAERKNRHLLEVARSLMFSSNLPKHFWGDAILTSAYLINRMPSRVLKFQSPHQVLLQHYPHSTFLSSPIPLKSFGCTAFVHIPPQFRSKLDPQSIKCIFLGYSPNQKGYKCYSPTTKRIYNSMDVTFFESQPFYHYEIQGEIRQESQWQNTISTDLDMPHIIQEPNISNEPSEPEIIDHPEPTSPALVQPETSPALVQPEDSNSVPTDESTGTDNIEREIIVTNDIDIPIAQRKGTRSCTNHPWSKHLSYSRLSQTYRTFITSLDNIQIPVNITEALKHTGWTKAVNEEILALEKNHTWRLTELPPEKKAVGCRWIFTVKHKADGSIERLKARLVAKGYTQSYGIDYQETFAPVAKLNTVRILLSLAVNCDWDLHQLDVKNAFLNGDLEEEVYMEIPPGFETTQNSNKVCRLQKALYGLKQSPRAWFGRFNKFIVKLGYKQCQSDHTMFVKFRTKEKIAILIVYVDDIILTGNDKEELVELKGHMAKEFEIKDLGPLRYFLGMEVARSRKGIVISQRKYVMDLLSDTGMTGSKPADTPIDAYNKIGTATNSAHVDRGRYQRLVGRLIYLAHTRPDIGFSVSVVSQHMNNPTEEHMDAVTRILRYLKMKPGNGLLFKKSDSRDLEVYTDADWAGDISDRRSTSGYCSYVWGNLVTWRSKKQSVVARSSAEAEFRSLSQGICEGIWIQRVLAELGMGNSKSIRLYCDNQAAISIAKNPVHHDRTKHIEIDRHFIAEKIENSVIQIVYTPTRFQTADILTKALPRINFEELSCKLGMYNLYNPA